MPNSLHTQGDWGLIIPRIERPRPYRFIPERRLLVVHPDGERIIADFSVGYVGEKGNIPLAEREANARLCRAAPKMLAALEIAIAIADSAKTAGRKLSDNGEFLAAARAAVAAANEEA